MNLSEVSAFLLDFLNFQRILFFFPFSQSKFGALAFCPDIQIFSHIFRYSESSGNSKK